jgi:hypothetical protein
VCLYGLDHYYTTAGVAPYDFAVDLNSKAARNLQEDPENTPLDACRLGNVAKLSTKDTALLDCCRSTHDELFTKYELVKYPVMKISLKRNVKRRLPLLFLYQARRS